MAKDRPQRLVILLSGRGSHFENLHRNVHANSLINAEIVGVIADRADAAGLAKAQRLGVATALVRPDRHSSSNQFEHALVTQIRDWHADWVILAGFMRILTPTALMPFEGRMLNIHPSLLPKYKGLDTHRRALEAGDGEHGASVHFVTAALDGGPVLSQVRMRIDKTDTATDLAERLLPLEHQLMQASVALLTRHAVEYRNEDIAIDGQNLVNPMVLGRDLDVTGHWQPHCPSQ